MVEHITEDVLIIGAGAAGAMTAITLEENGVTPLVVSKHSYGDAHTKWARGGINASLGSLDDEDSWEIHAADTLDEGHFVNDPDAVRVVAENMPDIISLLDEWGMAFDRTDDGKINQRYFGAQSFRRTCFVGDYTGEALLETLVSRAQSLGVPYRDGVFVTDLVTDDAGGVDGAVGYDMDSGEVLVFEADEVVVAAGGYTTIYNRSSSFDGENTGDGVGLAYLAGADIIDTEFIQFHPTGMVGARYGDEWDGRLVTEAVRGEGGRLFNTEGERFMEKYSPDQMELDARDVVARAISSEIEAGRGTENGGVLLDISHRDEEFIQDRLPRMYERFMELGVNIAEEPMEVAPTAHYAMGGVAFDAWTGQTTVDGLRVVGESSAGVHGANRLGGNSLAETVAVGREVGNDLVESDRVSGGIDVGDDRVGGVIERYGSVVGGDDGVDPYQIRSEIRDVMEEYGGIVRDAEQLRRGIQQLLVLKEQYTNVSVSERESEAFAVAQNLRFMLIVAEATLRGALERAESRGAHYRADYPDKDSDMRVNYVYSFDDDGNMEIRSREIGEISDRVQVAIDEQHELDYHHLE